MMLDLAEALNPLLDARKVRQEQGLEDDEDVADTTLQLVFFDGEEAFRDWTSVDSIYGARYELFLMLIMAFSKSRSTRHLADKWSTTYISPNTKRRLRPQATELNTIEHFILLDLLGAANPVIHPYFLDTAWLYDAMVSVEQRLADSGSLTGPGESVDGWKSFFVARTGREFNNGMIEDDHIPFLRRGVSVLHLIASPFPRVWHTLRVSLDQAI